MDPRTNPYAPGAGTIPPELAGREDLIEKADIALDRCRNGLSAQGLLLVGLRGVGKTVLLTRIAKEAEAKKFCVVSIESSENRSLPAILVPALRTALLKLDLMTSLGATSKRALQALGSFISSMKVRYQDIEFGADIERLVGVADSGDFEHDLTELFLEIGAAVKEKKTALLLIIDEIQYLEEDQFAVLITALHKANQNQLPIVLIGAGLPQLIGRAGRAKSYAERLFEYPQVGPLNKSAAKIALCTPAERYGVTYTEDAIELIYKQTQGYPYFLQEWGKYSWHCASQSPITVNDVQKATELAISELDTSFFRVRFDRLNPSEKRYLRAMSELGSEKRSGDIAKILEREVQSVAPIRASLIEKGMVYSRSHGDNSFTVPLFDDYMKRVMPNLNC